MKKNDIHEVPQGRFWNDARSIVGRRNDYGWCLRCGGTWNWKKRFEIPISPNQFCFPVCHDCAKDMSNTELLEEVDKLQENWAKSFPIKRPDGQILEFEPRPDGYAEASLEAWRQLAAVGEDPWATEQRLKQGGVN